jgi:serine/threonine protein phosphatase PrpC
VILATDGLFECVSSQSAVDAIGSLLSKGPGRWPPWKTSLDTRELHSKDR